MEKTIIMLSIITVLLMLSCMQVVYAADDDVNLQKLPDHLAKRLNIPLFAAQLLACSIFLLMFLLPIALFSRGNLLLSLIVGIILLGFFIAVGWLSFWVLLILVLIVASLWSGKIRGWLS